MKGDAEVGGGSPEVDEGDASIHQQTPSQTAGPAAEPGAPHAAIIYLLLGEPTAPTRLLMDRFVSAAASSAPSAGSPNRRPLTTAPSSTPQRREDEEE